MNIFTIDTKLAAIFRFAPYKMLCFIVFIILYIQFVFRFFFSELLSYSLTIELYTKRHKALACQTILYCQFYPFALIEFIVCGGRLLLLLLYFYSLAAIELFTH